MHDEDAGGGQRVWGQHGEALCGAEVLGGQEQGVERCAATAETGAAVLDDEDVGLGFAF